MRRRRPNSIAAAARLRSAGGRGPPIALAQLAGGKNNRVFRCDVRGRAAAGAEELFFRPARSARPADRGMELSVLCLGPRRARDPGAGRRRSSQPHRARWASCTAASSAPDDIGVAEIDVAADFVAGGQCRRRAIPRRWRRVRKPAFSLAQHLATVDRRVERLPSSIRRAPCRVEAERLIAGQLVPEWQRLERPSPRPPARGGIDAEA